MSARLSNDDLVEVLFDTLELFLADHPDLEGRDVVIEDMDPHAPDVVSVLIGGQRFAITVEAEA